MLEKYATMARVHDQVMELRFSSLKDTYTFSFSVKKCNFRMVGKTAISLSILQFKEIYLATSSTSTFSAFKVDRKFHIPMQHY